MEEEDGGEDQQRDIEPGALDQALALGASALAQVDAPPRFEPGRRGEGKPGSERAGEREQPGLHREAGVEQFAAADAGDRVERAGVVQREGGERRAQHGGGRGDPESEHRLRGGLLPCARASGGEPLAVVGGARGDAAADQRDGEERDGDQLEAGEQGLSAAEGCAALVVLQHPMQERRSGAAFEPLGMLEVGV